MEAYQPGADGSIIVTANEREKLAIMETYGQAILIHPDNEGESNAIFCAMCQEDREDYEPTPFMVCNCLQWNCIKNAVREHLEFHADKLLVVREN